MMQSLSLSQLVPILNAQLAKTDAYFYGVSTDTRTIKEGDLFVALSGVQFDAHDFLQAAKEKGASGALVNRFMDVELPQLKVKDTRQSLGDLAAFNRCQFEGPVIAVTGSNGKTTTKEMMAAILCCRGEVLATRGNLNNDIGAPLTLLSLSKNHAYAVIELGASAIGEIAYTSKLTQPHVSVLTNASNAHVEGFGSLAGVVQAKGEIFDVLENTKGVAIINADDNHAPIWLERAKNKKIKKFSTNAQSGADYFATNITVNKIGQVGFYLHAPVGEIDIQLNLLGKHNIGNALAAAAATLAVGASLYDVKFGLEAMQPVSGRLNAKIGINNNGVIDDTYNANPNSMRAAIDCLAELPNKKILVIGDMAELGDDAFDEHAKIGVYAKQKDIHCLYGIGPLSARAVAGFGQGAIGFDNHQAVIEHLKNETQPFTALVKGSRSAHMEVVVHALLKAEEK
jgi:UDP-N-acetylmuramoyl-tripeptide--D-alanyl-D-alanine ligase